MAFVGTGGRSSQATSSAASSVSVADMRTIGTLGSKSRIRLRQLPTVHERHDEIREDEPDPARILTEYAEGVATVPRLADVTPKSAAQIGEQLLPEGWARPRPAGLLGRARVGAN